MCHSLCVLSQSLFSPSTPTLTVFLKPWDAAGINPDVALESYTMNITTLRGFAAFKDSLVGDDGQSSRVDLVLSCVDNYEARMTINEARSLLAALNSVAVRGAADPTAYVLAAVSDLENLRPHLGHSQRCLVSALAAGTIGCWRQSHYA